MDTENTTPSRSKKALVDAMAERLAEKVEEGRITQEEADEKTERIADKVDGVDSDANEEVGA